MKGLARNSSKQDPGDASACPEPSEPALVNYHNQSIRIKNSVHGVEIFSAIYIYIVEDKEKKHDFSFLHFFAQIC